MPESSASGAGLSPPGLPSREDLADGLTIERVFSSDGEHPFDTCAWERRDAAITNPKGETIFEQKDVEFPEPFSQLATNVVASKYFYGDLDAGNGSPEDGQREYSLKQLVHRVTHTITEWGREQGYFATDADADRFYDELTWLCTHQHGAFNSPVWFNVGLGQQYGVRDTGDKKIFGWDFDAEEIVQVDPYVRPQASACFIVDVEDSIDGIWKTMGESARLFKFGSGVGADWSTLRSSKEKLSGGGIPSGPVSFMKVQDATGGTIKSGGKTRRAAIMQTLKCWHPDVEHFVEVKQNEERKAWALIEQGYDGSFNGPAYGSVDFQNVNHSLRVTDAFMDAAEKGESYPLRAVTTNEVIDEIDAAELLKKVAEGTHVCGDPGLQYEDTIQKWHTCKNTDAINSSNPCCFVGETLVHTDEGLLSFDALYARAQRGEPLPNAVTRGVAALPDGDAELDDVSSPIRSVWVAGHTTDLVEVTLSNGAVLRCTPDHRFLEKDDLAWIEAQDLTPGTMLTPHRDGFGVTVQSVSAVHFEEPVTVYDMEVADVHAFAVTSDAAHEQGVIVHNSEYMFLDNSACNLASLNLRKYQREDGSIDVERLRAAARIFITAQEILVDNAGYPSRKIAENSHKFRPLGLGFANLGALLMSMGFPYDSDEGRAVAGAIMAIEHCEAYARSAEIAANKDIGPFDGYAENEEPFLEVMRMHQAAVEGIEAGDCPDDLLDSARESAARMVALGEKFGYRNAQATVLAPTGCLVENSLVSTSRGLVRLGTLGNTDGEQWQSVSFDVFTDEGTREATNFYVNGEAPTRKIQTSSGYTIQGTHKHKVKVVDPTTGHWTWKRFDGIEEGDIVPLAMNTLVGDPNTVRLPPLGDLHWNADYETTVPRTFTAELAELVGYFMGDGSLHAKGLRFCVDSTDADVVDRLSHVVKSLFNLETHVAEQNGYLEVAVHSVPLAMWWEACGFKKLSPEGGHSGKGYHPYIPDALLHTNDPAIYSAFIRGLFEADGTLLSGVPAFCTASEDFAGEVRSMLLALGYPTNTRQDEGGWGGTTYILRLKNRAYNAPFRSKIGFMSVRKQQGIIDSATNGSAQGDRVYVTRQLVDELVPVDSNHRNAVLTSLRRHNAVPRQRLEQIFEETGDKRLVRYMGYFYDTVEVNEDGGVQPTYDLSVPDNVTYTANGFISHNTIGFYMDCDTTGIEPDIALVKYKLLAGEGDGMMKIVNQSVPHALERLGYSDDEVDAIIDYIDDNDTIEGAPALKDEHLPVFDCAFKPANGERSIHHLGHIRMMGAVQPFVSGSISKTCNMPEDATVEDIADAYQKGWELGLKAIAIYRENSKRSQPLSTSEDGNTQNADTDKATAAEPSGDGVASETPEIREKVVYKPTRKRLPDERPSITHKFSIAGHEGYLTVGLYPESVENGNAGRPGEIFITMAKQGSTLAGMMDAFATSISIALQYGVPLEDLCRKFSHMRFEPSGFTNNQQIPIAKSIMDYIFRYLSIKFLDATSSVEGDAVNPNPAAAEESRRSGPSAASSDASLEMGDLDDTSDTLQDDLVGQTVEAFMDATSARPETADAIKQEAQDTFQNQSDAPPCPECGSITVRNGSCYMCVNCGASTGCG